jgi:dsDNA-specific endonuclease/ATPase MutS2
MFKKNNSNDLIKELDYIEAIKTDTLENKDILDEIQYIFCKIKDIKNTVKRLANKDILDEIELFEIKNFAINTVEIIKNYNKLNLKIDYINFKDLKKIIEILDPDNLKLSTFHIYDSYSNDLSQIRKSKAILENKIFTEVDIEKVEKLKAQRLEKVVQEEKEQIKIKKQLSNSLYYYIEDINVNIKSIGKLDFLIAKTNLAIKYNAIKPSINNENKIYLKNIINPKVKSILNKESKKYMPISIDINKKITLITGANMGGKSVSMNTIVLNLYLFQCGFYVFGEEANLCVLDFIYLISDDMQDISKGLSTFGAEIIKLKEITKLMKHQDGFIALDEFARGTNPSEGKILLKSICTYFKRFNSISLISTHYDEVMQENVDHYQVVGLKNVDFEGLKRQVNLKLSSKGSSSKSIDILQDNMDYRLEKVNKEAKVPKDALNICKLLGLSNEIIEIAQDIQEKQYKGDKNE